MKRYSILVAIGLLFSLHLFSQHSIVGSNEKTGKNKGVHIPVPIGYTSDFVHLFTKNEVENLDSIIERCNQKDSIQFSVATIDSASMGVLDINDYSLLMFQTWEVGEKKKDNGVLILLAPDMRRIRIQNGYGIEKYLSNRQTKMILDTIVLPYFKTGKFYQGTKEAVLAITKEVRKRRVK